MSHANIPGDHDTHPAVELLDGPALATLEGNEVAHIANMDGAEPVPVHVNNVPVPVHVHHHEEHPVEEVPEQQLPTEMSWHDFFNALQAHYGRFGTLDIEPNTNPGLEHWVDEQRSLYQEEQGIEANNTLTVERRLLLDALGFDWEGVQEPEYNDQSALDEHEEMDDVESFNLRLEHLQEYKEINGHPNVPEIYEQDIDLGKWVGSQRSLYRRGALTQDRVDALVSMGFDFAPGDQSISFEDRIQQLNEYKEMHGDVIVPRKWGLQHPGEHPGYVNCDQSLP